MGRWWKILSPFRRLKSARGFTLLEMVMSLAILATGLPAIAMMMVVALQQDRQIGQETQARYLANSLLSEISQRRFRESTSERGNGVETGEADGWVRTAFDDVDDYAIFTETWAAVSPPRNEAGEVITGFEAFTQRVSVVNVPAPTVDDQVRALTSVGEGSTDFKLVTVTISWEGDRRSVIAEKLFALSLPEDSW